VGSGHSWNKGVGRLAVDATKFYQDLVDFLAREASDPQHRSTHVWVRESFRFNTGFARATRDEALRLGAK
jgi:hypothetical protein